METYRVVGRTTTGMSNDPAVETLHTVDDRSKVVAVLSTAAAFGAGLVRADRFDTRLFTEWRRS